MTTGQGFKVTGLASATRSLRALGLDVDDLTGAFSKIAQTGANVAAQEAPKRTGRLANTIRGNRARSKAVIRAGFASVPYAGAINYGWPKRGIRANGFMQRTDQKIQPFVLQMLEAEINNKARQKGLT